MSVIFPEFHVFPQFLDNPEFVFFPNASCFQNSMNIWSVIFSEISCLSEVLEHSDFAVFPKPLAIAELFEILQLQFFPNAQFSRSLRKSRISWILRKSGIGHWESCIGKGQQREQITLWCPTTRSYLRFSPHPASRWSLASRWYPRFSPHNLEI